ncbi:MAG: TauD/TfdA family dioxygenase [Nocardioidaceae bacterium]
MSAFGATVVGDGGTLLDVDAAHVERQLADHGYVLLRGLRDAIDRFDSFTDQFGRARPANLRVGSPRRFAGDRGSQYVTPGTGPVPLHAESYFTPLCPDVVAFGCVEAGADGGHTLLCDGRALLASLPAEDRAILERTSILWEYRATVAELESQTRAPLADTVNICRRQQSCTVAVRDAIVEIRYSAPAIRRTRFPGAPALANSLIPIKEAGGLGSACPGLPEEVVTRVAAHAERMTVQHRWSEGDIVLVDNSRVMHGRTAIEAGTRRILVRMVAVEA